MENPGEALKGMLNLCMIQTTTDPKGTRTRCAVTSF